jgi:hypothetical protein
MLKKWLIWSITAIPTVLLVNYYDLSFWVRVLIYFLVSFIFEYVYERTSYFSAHKLLVFENSKFQLALSINRIDRNFYCEMLEYDAADYCCFGFLWFAGSFVRK